MRFVDHHQVEIAPIQCREINAIDLAAFARQIGMRQYGVCEPVLQEGIEFAIVLGEIDGPVVTQLFRAQHQNAMIAKLEILDDREGGIGLAQANAVGKDATVVGVDLMDCALDAIFLEVK